MKIAFENNLQYQLDAIQSLIDVFRGQEQAQSTFTVLAPKDVKGAYTTYQNETGYGNKLFIGTSQLVENVQQIQLRNGLPISTRNEIYKDKALYFPIEMETGTGKTYVFLRSIMEMHRRYGFTKFVIVVPSLAIKEGIKKSLEITEDRFKEDFNNEPYHYFVYDSKDLSLIRGFAVSNQIEIMVTTIQSFSEDLENKDEAKRILNKYNDKLGNVPISLLKGTNPIVIVDEPQSTLSTDQQKKAIDNLHPLAIFGFSATHRGKTNLLYKLDAIDAYNNDLVKKIEVGSFATRNEASDGAYIRLLKTVSDKKGGIKAELVVDVKGKNGIVNREFKTVKTNQDLYDVTKLDQYDNFLIRDIGIDPAYVEFTNGQVVKLNQVIGGMQDIELKRAMIRKTIEAHLEKELVLNPRGIKVLSLFFIDEVDKYRHYDENGNASNGIYAQIFEEEYTKASHLQKYQSLFKEIKDIHTEVALVHDGYFSMDKKGGQEFYIDSTGKSQKDDSAFERIMKNKEELLSFGDSRTNKIRFIFSHSALKEGWDNPNVFQICTLKDAGKSEIRRRQEIGRGLRIAVNQAGQRVYDKNVNILTVMASESYESFVKGFQEEITEDTGIKFGYLSTNAFSNVIVAINNEQKEYLGEDASRQIIQHFREKGYIDNNGKVLDSLKLDFNQGTVDLGADYAQEVALQINQIVKEAAGKLDIKNREDRKPIAIRKEVFLSDDFKILWDNIKYKTKYNVSFDSDTLIKKCIESINLNLIRQNGKLVYTRTAISINKGGVEGDEANRREDVENLRNQLSYIPDIVSYIQNATNLTRSSILKILTGLEKGKLTLLKENPQKFMEGCIGEINDQMKLFLVDGIKYTKLGDNYYYEQSQFENEELLGYLHSNIVESHKSVYEYTVYDSGGVEKRLVQEFENSPHIKLYTKLPDWFKIDTPLGTYNPDWAIVYVEGNDEKLYFVVESKSSMNTIDLRPTETKKIECGIKHFEAIGSKMIKANSLEMIQNQI